MKNTVRNRDQYLNKLIMWMDKPLIKVITGVRRCGKSSLLLLFQEHLEMLNISNDQIIFMNFESMLFDDIEDYKELYREISSKITRKDVKYYILLDEVQLVDHWERCINSLVVDYDVDLYLTGSNSYMLSSELSTLLAGRYVEIQMLPLSFGEYLTFTDTDVSKGRKIIEERFNDFLKYGALPAVALYADREEVADELLLGIYNTVVMKDIIKRNQVRDPALLDSLIRFLAGNVGNIVSTKKISDYLTSAGRKTTSDTIDNYLRMVESSFIAYKVNRYDLKGKLHLKTLEKYYLVDTGIRYLLAGRRYVDEGHVIENVIYLELLRRGYTVDIGKFAELEVDFVAVKNGERQYIQVSLTIEDEATREREIRPLFRIRDNYPKLLIIADNTSFGDIDGIRVVNIIDYLLGPTE